MFYVLRRIPISSVRGGAVILENVVIFSVNVDSFCSESLAKGRQAFVDEMVSPYFFRKMIKEAFHQIEIGFRLGTFCLGTFV